MKSRQRKKLSQRALQYLATGQLLTFPPAGSRVTVYYQESAGPVPYSGQVTGETNGSCFEVEFGYDDVQKVDMLDSDDEWEPVEWEPEWEPESEAPSSSSSSPSSSSSSPAPEPTLSRAQKMQLAQAERQTVAQQTALRGLADRGRRKRVYYGKDRNGHFYRSAAAAAAAAAAAGEPS